MTFDGQDPEAWDAGRHRDDLLGLRQTERQAQRQARVTEPAAMAIQKKLECGSNPGSESAPAAIGQNPNRQAAVMDSLSAPCPLHDFCFGRRLTADAARASRRLRHSTQTRGEASRVSRHTSWNCTDGAENAADVVVS